MKIKFYVINQDRYVYPCFLLNRTSKDSYLLGCKTGRKIELENSRIFKLNCYGFYLFLNEIDNCLWFRYCVARNIKSHDSHFVIEITSNHSEYIDRIWGELIRQLIWEQLEMEHMMSWFSTLGGAFSALGDYFSDKSIIAGKISLNQMKLAYRIGDPSVISRCKLYLSISLIQQMRFRIAEAIVREQFEFAKTIDDTRLKKMCLGIWSKLQFSYKIYKQRRKNERRNKLM